MWPFHLSSGGESDKAICQEKFSLSLSNLLNVDNKLINLKGKTVEKLGLIGKEKAIACEVICSISQWKKLMS